MLTHQHPSYLNYWKTIYVYNFTESTYKIKKKIAIDELNVYQKKNFLHVLFIKAHIFVSKVHVVWFFLKFGLNISPRLFNSTNLSYLVEVCLAYRDQLLVPCDK